MGDENRTADRVAVGVRPAPQQRHPVVGVDVVAHGVVTRYNDELQEKVLDAANAPGMTHLRSVGSADR